MQRPSGRAPAQLRDINIDRHFTRHAEGSVLVSFGHTRVICTASVEQGVPRFMRGQGRGWVTAEYAMLPGATRPRGRRERRACTRSCATETTKTTPREARAG